MSLLPVETALERILARVPAPRGERVRLEEASGRVLFAPVVSTHDQPPFDASAMDGYALRAADVAEGAALALVGMSQAGAGFAGTLRPGQCVRIFTGAPVPPGADAVIMQEEAEAADGVVRFTTGTSPGGNIRKAGYDFEAGRELLSAGTRLTPFSLALVAAANQAEVSVARRPSVALLATGDELVRPGAPLAPDRIVASNSFGLVPLLSPYAETVRDLGIAPDTREALRSALETALEGDADIIVTTGGASVGEHDFVQEVLRGLGVALDFWRIDMRPGKPLMFGALGEKLVFGLPGNPVSAMVTASVFVKPALRRWLGHAALPEPMRLPLAAPLPPNSSRRHFMRARLAHWEGASAVLPIAETDSGHTLSLAMAEALIVQPEFDPGRPAGAMVEVLMLEKF